jgi:hypothetical protein
MKYDNQHDKCDNCGALFGDGEGVSGYNKEGRRMDYDWQCAGILNVRADDHGELTQDREEANQ